MLELGCRWLSLRPALIEAFETRSLPLISLTHEVKFAAITQAVGERVVDQQLIELRDAERVHETFTRSPWPRPGRAKSLAPCSVCPAPRWCWNQSNIESWT